MAKILVIEDNPVDAKMIRTNLKAEGYQVIGANNGKDGIKLAKKKKPDLIIMDMILPGMHGLEASIKL
ncbi:MAG: response regulator, partial [Candidatus Aminicenantes bacterium]|nr:response regulator [Candidatus Aminicenantes bacterium]